MTSERFKLLAVGFFAGLAAADFHDWEAGALDVSHLAAALAGCAAIAFAAYGIGLSLARTFKA